MRKALVSVVVGFFVIYIWKIIEPLNLVERLYVSTGGRPNDGRYTGDYDDCRGNLNHGGRYYDQPRDFELGEDREKKKLFIRTR